MTDRGPVETDDEFEGIGLHRDNPRCDIETALADQAAADAAAGEVVSDDDAD